MNHVIEMFERLKVPLEAIKLATNNFADKNYVGGGGFGKVYKGEMVLSGVRKIVALKRLDSKFGQGNPEFWKEIVILSLYKHENIVSLLGFCDESEEKILIYEYASKGSLDMYLSNNDLKWISRLNICIGAARGLAYLHDPGSTHQRVLHRDIKSSNILLDEDWNARIADLGLSKFGPANQQYTFLVSNAVGTIGYCDPLYVETGLLTKESDVYSFGVVLFEVLCGRLSIGNSSDRYRPLTGLVRQYYEEGKINEIIHASLKDEITPSCLQEFATIAYQCINRDLKRRPVMTEVLIALERALQYQNGMELPKQAPRSASACTPVEISMIPNLIRKLDSANPDEQRTAAGEIFLLAGTNYDNHIAIAEAGAIPLLTNLLSAPDSRTQGHAVTTLQNLFSVEDNKHIIVSSGAVPVIVQILKEGNNESRENAAAVLVNLSGFDEHMKIIGLLGAIPPLVLLLTEGTQEGKKNAVYALHNLCLFEDNIGLALKAGIVPPLMKLLTEPQSRMRDEVLATLARLSNHHEAQMAIGESEAVVPMLVESIGNGTPKNKEDAAHVLLHLFRADEKYIVKAQEVGGREVLEILLHHGTNKGKRKARLLLGKMTTLVKKQEAQALTLIEHGSGTLLRSKSL